VHSLVTHEAVLQTTESQSLAVSQKVQLGSAVYEQILLEQKAELHARAGQSASLLQKAHPGIGVCEQIPAVQTS
jgi:hypothetical protein